MVLVYVALLPRDDTADLITIAGLLIGANMSHPWRPADFQVLCLSPGEDTVKAVSECMWKAERKRIMRAYPALTR